MTLLASPHGMESIREVNEVMRQDGFAERAESLGVSEQDIGSGRRNRAWLTPLFIAASGLLVILAYLQGFSLSYTRNSYPFSIAAVAATSTGVLRNRNPLLAIMLVGMLCIVAFALGSILGARAAYYPAGIMYGAIDRNGLVSAQVLHQRVSAR